jgi:hypothetical protein
MTFDALCPAAAVRSAAASIAGVGVRDRSPEQRESLLKLIVDQRAKERSITADAALEQIGQEVVKLLDYAYDRVPGWRDLSQKRLSASGGGLGQERGYRPGRTRGPRAVSGRRSSRRACPARRRAAAHG